LKVTLKPKAYLDHFHTTQSKKQEGISKRGRTKERERGGEKVEGERENEGVSDMEKWKR